MSQAVGAGLTVTPLDGGVCAVPGVTAAGIAAGLKRSGRPDLALVDAGEVVPTAVVQTANQVVAAPVEVTRRHAAGGRARAVLLNAGSANACTGPDGLALAEESARVTADALGCAAEDVLLCSTGVIGKPITREPFLAGIPEVIGARSREGSTDAARAIMTTDTTVKESAVRVADEAGACITGGIAKGSGMIEPAFATMLCVLTTDAPVSSPVLKATLKDVVARTFGRISVDGCMSTNDAVVLLATGTAPQAPNLAAFRQALTTVCEQLAEAIVRDGEGATKLVRIRVTGARSEHDAAEVGRSVAQSALVKTAIAGEDPNWGRVLAAVGAGPVPIDPRRVAVRFGGVTVCRFGVAAAYDEGMARHTLRGSDVTLTIDLGLGESEATFLTCDLTHGYITINAEYTT